jgi:hypothetical protein
MTAPLRERLAREIREGFSVYLEGGMAWKDWPFYLADRIISMLGKGKKK